MCSFACFYRLDHKKWLLKPVCTQLHTHFFSLPHISVIFFFKLKIEATPKKS